MCVIPRGLKIATAIALCASGQALADPAAFDLNGPTLEVEVTRGNVRLPISQVPDLASGDRVWLKAVLSDGGAVHYLMVAAFLRGSTEPPPAAWFAMNPMPSARNTRTTCSPASSTSRRCRVTF